MAEQQAATIMLMPEIFDRAKAAIEREFPNAKIVEFPQYLRSDPGIIEYYIAPKEIE